MHLMKNRKSNFLSFSPSDLLVYFKSPFASWMDHYCLLNPSEKMASEIVEDESSEMMKRKGQAHELDCLKSLKDKYKRVVEIDRSQGFESCYKKTLKAMEDGADLIYQAALKKDDFIGYADFLIKSSAKSLETGPSEKTKLSKFGNYCYEVLDSKLSKKVKPEYVIQILCYSEMLSEIQEIEPPRFSFYLGNKDIQFLATRDYSAYYRQFKKSFLDFHHDFDNEKRPFPQSWESLGPWEEFGEKILRDHDHLSLVSGMNASSIKKLGEKGIHTLSELAKASKKDRPEKMQDHTFDRICRQAALQKESLEKGKTQYELRQLASKNPWGLGKLPPHDPADVFFDMEGFNLIDGGLEYLFGVTYLRKSRPMFKDFWATDISQEQEAFEDWIDWVYSRWLMNPNMHIYHYASYEVTAMKKLMQKYIVKENEVDNLLRNHVFVDLYEIVREGLIVGAESYSIKKLEDLYDFKRKSDVQTSGDSMVQFNNWLENPDGADYTTSKILKEIRDYNQEDCDSTYELTKWLRIVQKKNKISYEEPMTHSHKIKEKTEHEKFQEEMLENLPAGKQEMIIQKNIAHLLGYHNRENKPRWWSFFDKILKTQEDLVDDFESIAYCQVVQNVGNKIVLQFDIEQDFKVKEDASMVFHHNPQLGLKINSIDFLKGKIEGTLSKRTPLPHEVTLIPAGPLKTATMEQAIFKTASEWNEHKNLKKLNPVLAHLFLRLSPQVLKSFDYFDYKDYEKLILSLDSSLLAIQGPPGTGKTYTASKMISTLLQNKKKIGITSNSHKAINLLMTKVHEELLKRKKRKGCSFSKINGKEDEAFLEEIEASNFTGARDFWQRNKTYDLVGGTSWLFAHSKSEGKFDYLFIEEAGQFSLANALACSSAAKNIVLLGDQMQLQQPVQGVHPGESQDSVLGYYVKGHDTIPHEMGLFLGESWRMRSKLCHFVSEMVYENRLKSHPSTQQHIIKLKTKSVLPKDEGILYVPIDHEGNTQGSDEEAQEILRIVERLKGSKVSDKNGTRDFSLNDCLFIAPYNYQVGKLKSVLGPEAKVGSVDLFQGQEAPIVFISMCSSDGESSPRGLDFILDKNRMNVAISRAKTLALVVGSPKLASSRASTVEHMSLLNLYCRICEN